jgi:hypothetical protein
MEYLKDSDFNISIPYAWKRRKIDDANRAMDVENRVILQIAHWEAMPDDTPNKFMVLDELYYLKDGKV